MSNQTDQTVQSDQTAHVEKIALTPLEVAEMTGLTRNTIYEEVNTGRLPSTRVGKRGTKILISRAAVDEWLKGG
jgi:excisionase family DNA binding protein